MYRYHKHRAQGGTTRWGDEVVQKNAYQYKICHELLETEIYWFSIQ